jgi:hypothetical protein
MAKLTEKEFFNLFKENVSFKEISSLFGLPKAEIYYFFEKYIEENAYFKYEKYLKKYLPGKRATKNVVIMLNEGVSKYKIQKDLELIDSDSLFLIKLIKKKGLLNKIYNLKYKQNKDKNKRIKRGKIINNNQIPYFKNNWENKDLYFEVDNNFLLNRYIEILNRIGTKEDINKEEMFAYFNSSDKHSFKVFLGSQLSHSTINWIKNNKMINKKFLNNLDRELLAKQFLQKRVTLKALKRKSFKFPPSLSQLIYDISKQLDFKIAKNYYLKISNLEKENNKSNTDIMSDYEGIHMVSGLKYYYPENYLRDELAFKQKNHGFIIIEDILNYVENEAKEYGFVLREDKKIKRKNLLNIMYFLRHGEFESEAMDFLVYI